MFGQATYLLFEVGWGLPVLALQWFVGWRCLWEHRRILVLAVGSATIYLSAADSIAIQQHIWTLHPSRISGIRLLNVPIEETLFFLLTNSMVSQSVVLVLRSGLLRRNRQRQASSN